MRLPVLIFTFFFLSITVESQIVINEIMAANAGSHMETDYYNFPDWIEIFNKGTTQVNLSGYYLSDDINELKKWQFPSFLLSAGQYYIVYCDKEGTGSHSNFGLSADGETIYLIDNTGNIIDNLDYDKQYPDISYGRNFFDISQWLFCASPTPGSANLTTTATERSPAASFSIPAGRLSSSSVLNLAGSKIRYTINGNEPVSTSTAYDDPIALNKTMVVKAKTFKDGYLPGETYANTYFLSEHTFTLPVVSLSYNSDYFYDNTYGIYVTGTNGISQIGNCREPANFNQNWERLAYLEYFDINGIKKISQPVGMKVSGGCTRFYAQKSLSIYARDKYGNNDFDYPFFIQKPYISKVNSFFLRNSGNDFNASHLRDAFLQALVNRSLDLDLQAYQPVITYFNGQYWGIMNIREKVDEDYFLGNFNITDDSIDFMEGNLMSDPGYHYSAIRGSKVDFLNLIDFVTSNSLVNDDNYHAVVSQLDLQEYLNYMAVQIYIANTDWPGNNLKFWKRSPYGKWRWILFDTDFGFGATSYDHRTIEFATATEEVSWPNPPWSTLLFRKLLENDSFQKAFIRTLLTIRNTCFQPDWCNFVMDSLSSRIDYEMTYHKAKYGGSKTDWNNSLSRLKHFAANRYGFIPDYISSYFGLGGEKVNFSVENPHHTHGDVLVNESVIRNYPFSMQTFRDIALSLEAIPAKGYNFKHWKYADHTLTNTILPLGSEWSYLDVATDYPANWTTASFDDSSWKNGQGQLGYGDGDEATVISFGPDQNNKITTALFRKKFIMPDTAGISDIEMELQMDDGAVVYLNGQEIFRSNMPAGVIGFNTYASEPNDQVVVYTGVDKEAFVSGENVIACEMHQCNGTSSDLGFDISLTYTSVEESTGDIFSYEAFIQSDTSFNIALEPVFESIDAIQGVHLNEIAPVTRNFRDEYDEKSGFVELYNNNGEDMTLFSFFISDDAGNLMRYAIPDSTVIPADGFITFYLDGEAKQGSYHTNFKADPDGESMYLSQKVGETITILDSVSFELLVADHSFGKYTDGTGNWQYMVNMTPGLPNDPEVLNCSEEYRTFTTYVRIYPNPSRGNVFISIEEDDIHTHVYSINIIDICGKVVYPKIWLNSNSSSVNLTNLSRGLYFVRLYKDHQPVNTSKLILLE